MTRWTWNEKIPEGPRDVVVVYQIKVDEGLKELTLNFENCERFPLLEGEHEKEWKNVIGRITFDGRDKGLIETITCPEGPDKYLEEVNKNVVAADNETKDKEVDEQDKRILQQGSLEEGQRQAPAIPEGRSKNFWQELDNEFIYWKMKPTKGIPHPEMGK